MRFVWAIDHLSTSPHLRVIKFFVYNGKSLSKRQFQGFFRPHLPKNGFRVTRPPKGKSFHQNTRLEPSTTKIARVVWAVGWSKKKEEEDRTGISGHSHNFTPTMELRMRIVAHPVLSCDLILSSWLSMPSFIFPGPMVSEIQGVEILGLPLKTIVVLTMSSALSRLDMKIPIWGSFVRVFPTPFTQKWV